MKLMAAADLHGSRHFCTQLLEAFAREAADRLLLLGDILSPGDSAGEEKPGEDAAAQLNSISSRIICVRGNCDWATNQQRLAFPCMDEYTLLRLGKQTIFATHGHHYNEHRLPPLPFDILLHGHTHVPAYREHDGYIYLNPGSISRPRGGSKNGYMVLQEQLFIWKGLDGKELFRYAYHV